MSKITKKPKPVNWSVMGIQHAIFKRILPHLLHDIASPLSVALLQTGIIKRKLKAENPNIPDMLQHAGDMDSHLRQGVSLIRTLREWDHETEHFFSTATIFEQSIKFFRTKLALRGIELVLIESEAKPVKADDFQSLAYNWLALLCYLEDTLQAAYRVEVNRTGENALSIHWQEKAGGNISPEALGFYDERIGRQELTILNEYYANTIEFAAESIVFRW